MAESRQTKNERRLNEEQDDRVERNRTYGTWFLWIAAVAGVTLYLIGLVGIHQASQRATRAEEQTITLQADLRQEIEARLTANRNRLNEQAVDDFQRCERANLRSRPAQRIVAQTLLDLVVSVNAADLDDTLPPTFRLSVAQLQDALNKLEDENCKSLYPTGYQILQQRIKSG